jgi:fibronectin-binding autotransporter adhesin
MKNSILTYFVPLFMLFNFSTGFAQTSWKGITSSNWATASNWTAGVPDATSDVFIGNASFTGSFQPTIGLSTAVRSISIGETVLSELTVLDSLTVNGNININPNGSLVIGNTIMSVSGNLLNDGNVTNIGTLNFFPNSTPVILKLSGISFSSAGLIQFGGSEAISISGSPTALEDVIISNTNPAGITPASDWNMTGNFSVNSNAIFNAGNHSYLVQGNVLIDGILNGNASTFAMSCSTGQLDASIGTTFNHLIILGTVTGFSDISLTGDFINYGSYDGSQGTLIMTGSTDAVIGGSTTPMPIEYLSIDKTGAAVVTADVDINNITTLNINSGTLSTSVYTIQQNPAGGTFNIASGGTLKIGGNNTLPAFSIYGFASQYS